MSEAIAPDPKQQHPFQPGVKVVVVTRGGFGSGVSLRDAVVAKVYKSGNFTLEGSPQQWRVHRTFGADKPGFAAIQTSRPWGETVQLPTDELREEVAASVRRHEFRQIILSLDNYRGKVSAEQLETIRALNAALAEKP